MEVAVTFVLTCQSIVYVVMVGPEPQHGGGQCPHMGHALLGHVLKVGGTCPTAKETVDV